MSAAAPGLRGTRRARRLMAGFPTAAAHLQLGRAVTGIARGPLACRARRPGEKFCLNKTDSPPLAGHGLSL